MPSMITNPIFTVHVFLVSQCIPIFPGPFCFQVWGVTKSNILLFICSMSFPASAQKKIQWFGNYNSPVQTDAYIKASQFVSFTPTLQLLALKACPRLLQNQLLLHWYISILGFNPLFPKPFSEEKQKSDPIKKILWSDPLKKIGSQSVQTLTYEDVEIPWSRTFGRSQKTVFSIWVLLGSPSEIQEFSLS